MCARCELVNLDTFPAFPFCEACGARLPSLRRFGWRGPLRRPALPLVWAIVLGAGVTMLGVLSLGLTQEAREPNRGRLVLDARNAPDAHDRRAQIWTLKIRPADAGDHEPLHAVRLRLSFEDETRWRFSVVSPTPDTAQSLGNGRYFGWSQLPRSASVQLRLVVPDTSKKAVAPLRLWWMADGFEALPLLMQPNFRPVSRASWNRVRKSFTLRPRP